MALSKTGRFLTKAEILGVGVFSPLSIVLRPLSAICAQSSTIVHFCGLFGPLSKGNFRRKMTTIVGNRGQLWTST